MLESYTLRDIAKKSYPSYKGRKIKVQPFRGPMSLDSYWNGGSRDYYVFFDLKTGKTVEIHSNHPAFEPNQPRKLNSLPEDIVVVNRLIFMGKEAGITIYADPINIPKLLEHP